MSKPTPAAHSALKRKQLADLYKLAAAEVAPEGKAREGVTLGELQADVAIPKRDLHSRFDLLNNGRKLTIILNHRYDMFFVTQGEVTARTTKPKDVGLVISEFVKPHASQRKIDTQFKFVA